VPRCGARPWPLESERNKAMAKKLKKVKKLVNKLTKKGKKGKKDKKG
jgi:hypothetical protein